MPSPTTAQAAFPPPSARWREDTNGCVDRSGEGAPQVSRPRPVGDPPLRGPGAHDPGRSPDKIDRFLDLSRKMGVDVHGARDSSPIRASSTSATRERRSPTSTWISSTTACRGCSCGPRGRGRIIDEAPPAEPEGLTRQCSCAVLGRWNVCSKEYVVRQYDHEVQAGSVVKPLTGRENDGPTDAAVVQARSVEPGRRGGEPRHLPEVQPLSTPITWRPAP